MVPTRLGDLSVQVCGAGPTAVLWHSLFVDSTTWEQVRKPLSAARRLLIIDGPSHGGSPGPGRIFTIEECADAARAVLTHFGVTEPVDWVGNAWGGHVGILFAATSPERCRSLVTIGTPVHALTRAERPKCRALVAAYRLTGPMRSLVNAVTDALLGPRSADRDPASARLVGDAFRHAARRGMYLAMRSVMLNRPDLTSALRVVSAPTLVVAGADDSMWTPDRARAAAALPSRGACRVVPGAGHVAPLLDDASALAELITIFWRDHLPRSTP
ncbi:MAG: alpha/beta fold hydrolase [Candidatus Dormibacteraeota bacterium]|uniref:Alpha/beta fold hydrolase n=1 Tax=Candidatus Aeolococcus gillhamiae TaxID=3127015 RepID=A0A934JYR6_9BACT|nr:alpha/beta fold hydrolase [Candidatus Dormibacteraeota bacterium]